MRVCRGLVFPSSRLLRAEMLSMNFKFQDVPDNQSAIPYSDDSLHYRSRHTIYRHCLNIKSGLNMPIVLLFLYGYNGYVTSFKQGIGAKHSGNLAYLLMALIKVRGRLLEQILPQRTVASSVLSSG